MKPNQKSAGQSTRKGFNTNHPAFVFLIFFTCTFLLYGKTISYDFNLDDNYYFELIDTSQTSLKNVFCQSFSTIFNSTQYRPVTTLSLAMESYFFGNSPGVFHCFNLLYYTLLIYVIYHLLSITIVFRKHNYLLFICLLFLIHPVHAEVVSSIKNRESILSLLFCCLSILFAMRAISGKSLLFLLLTCISIACSLLSKIDCTPLLLVFPVYIYFKSADVSKRKILTVALFLITLVIAVSIASSNFIEASAPAEKMSYVDKGENPIAEKSSAAERIPMAIGTLGYYIKFIFVPTGYYFYYGTNMLEIASLHDSFVLISLLLIILLSVVIVLIYKQTNDKSILSGTAWFLVAISPFLNYVTPVAGIVAVRYVFAASLGLLVVSGLIYFYIFEKINKKYNLPVIIFWLPLVIYAPLTIKEINKWKDIDTLIGTDIDYMQESVVGNRIAAARSYKLSGIEPYQKAMHLQRALTYCERGLTVYPDDGELLNTKAKTLIAQNNYFDAETVLKKAVTDSTNRKSINMLASLYLNQQRKQDAKLLLDSSISKYKIAEALIQLNDIYISEDSIDRAIAFNKLYVKDQKLMKTANQILGDCYLMKSDTLKSIQYYYTAFTYGYENKRLADEIIRFLKSKELNQEVTKFDKYK
jgi:protein O-mannosyl-transferase